MPPRKRAPREQYDLNSISPLAKGQSTFDWALRRRDTTVGATTVHFGDLLPALVEFIEGSDAIVGCVAWVTSADVVDALSLRPVSLIVNKEPALRTTGKASAGRQRETLARLVGGLRRRDFPAPLSEMFRNVNDFIDPVRVTGHTGARAANSPLMHHKFAVRLTNGQPTAVWAGSFNWTKNASSSIENAVEIHDTEVAAIYLAEYARVAALSEPMNYTSPRPKPQWHIGTTQEAATRTAAAPTRRAAPAAKPPAARKPAVRKPAAKKPTTRRKPTASAPSTVRRPPVAKKPAA